MNTELATTIPEGILKLLGSSNHQDILIGAMWCRDKMGVDWCKKNFNFVPSNPVTGGPNQSNFLTHPKAAEEGEKLIVLKDLVVLVGSISLEYKENALSRKEVIYEEK